MNEQFQATPDPSNYQHFHLRKEEDGTVSRQEGGRREEEARQEQIRLSYIYNPRMGEGDDGTLRKGNFTLDIWGEEEDGSYITVEGWTTGELWNGWSVPFFKLPELKQVLQLCTKCNLGRFTVFGIGTIEPNDTFEFIENVGRQNEFVADEDGSYTVAPDEEGFYDLGARRWTWEEIARPIQDIIIESGESLDLTCDCDNQRICENHCELAKRIGINAWDLVDALSIRNDEPNKIIEITEYLCEPETMPLEDFITSCTIDALGVPLDPCEDASVFMPEKQIEQLRFLDVDASMPFGEPEAGLTIKRIK